MQNSAEGKTSSSRLQSLQCIKIVMKEAQVIFNVVHPFKNPSNIYLGTRHHLQKPTAFGLAEFDPLFNRRDLE
jgi:hypothetical protein